MTRYQACRMMGMDPLTSAFVAVTHGMLGAPKGKIAIMHMVISYDPQQPYRRGETCVLEDDSDSRRRGS